MAARVGEIAPACQAGRRPILRSEANLGSGLGLTGQGRNEHDFRVDPRLEFAQG
jgi:hypothetical protein